MLPGYLPVASKGSESIYSLEGFVFCVFRCCLFVLVGVFSVRTCVRVFVLMLPLYEYLRC